MSQKKAYQYNVLAVDDNVNALEIIKRNLEGAGHKVITCDSVQRAVEALNDNKIDLVITDLKMPKHSGLELVQHISENFPDIGVIMVTGYPSIEGAVAAIKKGAEEFLAKPFTHAELLSAVQSVLDRLTVQRNARATVEPDTTHGMVGRSEPMQQVFQLITKAATMTANVLISGESGTGKELVARAIHYAGERSSAPFVPVNCTAIPEGLLESELFGHEKGAFTGAHASRAGFFQVADGGTIFLDEIGDASQSMQAKLLRVMQDKEIIKIGSSQAIKVDARILAATNKDLNVLMNKNHFREDLYYRINVIDIHIPPLRERGEDVPLLVHCFISDYSKEMGRRPISLSDRAMQALIDYAWPGNVRELENIIQKLVLKVDKDIVDIADLPEPMRFIINHEKGLHRSLALVESEHITHVLASVGGNKTQAARILKIARKTLREKLRKIEQSNPHRQNR
ncbi:MAG: sigma-54-dependent Fis family transcriptional regulator [Deltaproteobacteria bacterium]|nr:sigma-54-dependent Fis family transcriptional regulator [Deltaproteobacteria bacterium]